MLRHSVPDLLEENAFLNGVAKGLSVENDALKGERDRAFMYADEMQKENERLRALADDAAILLDNAALDADEVEQWMARYREARGR